MNINVFRFEAYRKAFSAIFEQERKVRAGWSTAGLAEKIRVQPSHITNVVKERSHFSSDQIYAIGAEIGLKERETAYLDLLMEWERADFPARKSRLLEEIRATRDKALRADKNLEAQPLALVGSELERYYLDPNIELLHLYLETKNPPKEAEGIARIWGLPTAYVAEILAFLRKTNLVEMKKGRWLVKPVHQHLASTSPLAKPNQMLKRMRALEAIQKTAAGRVYSFTGTLTMTEETRLLIQAKFVDFLKEIEPAVVSSEPETIHHLQFDLFPWVES